MISEGWLAITVGYHPRGTPYCRGRHRPQISLGGLGWTHGRGERHFYVRQLRDMKIKPAVELFSPSDMLDYATLCGWTLARAHARSGDPAMMAGYIGKTDVFDKAVAAFSKAYADQAEQDHVLLDVILRILATSQPISEGLMRSVQT